MDPVTKNSIKADGFHAEQQVYAQDVGFYQIFLGDHNFAGDEEDTDTKIRLVSKAEFIKNQEQII